MTKEELEKEAEEYLENKHCKNVCTFNEIKECKKGIRVKCMSFNYRKRLIIDFAEPREERISELDKENGILEGKLADLQSEYVELENFHNNEVKELREQIEKMKCCENCKYNSYWGNELHCNYGLKEVLQEDKLVECKEMDKWEIKEND